MDVVNPDSGFTLYSLAKRAIAVSFVYKVCLRAVAWHGNQYLNRQKEKIIRQIGLPRELNEVVIDSIDCVKNELNRWISKHSQLFTNGSRKFYDRKKHLALFLDYVVWDSTQLRINDWATALEVIEANDDWPTMQFQFCCAYAMEMQLHYFTPLELNTFKRQMNEHPLFELWFSLLQHRKISIFEYGGHTPHQTVSDGFQWAVRFGYYELAQFIWYRIRSWQKEFLGMLHWRRLVAKAEDAELFQFIGNHLHEANPKAVVRITAQMFINNLKCAMENKRLNPQTDTPTDNRPDPWNSSYNDPWEVAKFLLDHSAPKMRHCLLSGNKFQAFTIAAINRDIKLFRELVGYLPPEDRNDLQKIVATELADKNVQGYLIRLLEDGF